MARYQFDPQDIDEDVITLKTPGFFAVKLNMSGDKLELHPLKQIRNLSKIL